MAEIAKEAKVSFGSVATYYGSKEELYMACIVQPVEGFIEEMLAFNTTPESYVDELHAMVRNHIEIFSVQKEYLRLIVQVTAPFERFNEAFQIINQYTVKIQTKIQELIINGQRDQQLSDGNAEKIAISYIIFLFGLRLSYADDPTIKDWNQFAEVALRLFGPK